MRTLLLILSTLLITTLSFSNLVDKGLYEKLNTPGLDKKVLNRALDGLEKIQAKNKDIITVIDYTKPSTEKRMFVIDLKNEKVIFDTYVAHGKNTGEKYAKSFSNVLNSKKSSVGFFKTSNSYMGINGYSMRLDGLEKGINDKARIRNIVIHGADYANPEYIQKNGRLGRSWGCPAVPRQINRKLIDTLKDGSVVYINGDLNNYTKKTKFFTK
jgi:hypothetical protein